MRNRVHGGNCWGSTKRWLYCCKIGWMEGGAKARSANVGSDVGFIPNDKILT